MIILDATNETIEITTSTTSAVDVVAAYADHTSTEFTPGSQETAISTATTTTVLAAPAASTQRQLKMLSIENKGSAANQVTIKKDVGGTEFTIYSASIQPGENVSYVDGLGFDKHAPAGDTSVTSSTDRRGPVSSVSRNILKVGGTAEAAGVLHFLGLSSGFPGAWSPGTPGLNGRATDGTTGADAGCIPIPNAVGGSNYLTSFVPAMTQPGTPMLIDVLWVNTGLVVTTTGAQAITAVGIPARDGNGATLGDDVQMGLLVTTATTNAAAVTNCTASYTDDDGNASTATMASFPATAAVGTLVPFQLAAGDTGVRAPTGVTLGTSLATGAVSLILYRIVAAAPHLVANAGGKFEPQLGVNTRLYDGACILPVYMPTVTTAVNLNAIVNVEVK